MRVVHLSTYMVGGAARSALRLHAGLLAAGVESEFLIAGGPGETPGIERMDEAWRSEVGREGVLFQVLQDWYVNLNRTEISNTFFSVGEPGINIALHPSIQRADIINLHWVAEFLSPRSIASLAALGKPIVWTIHDMRPMTGGCHFSAGCEKFTANCSGCPQLRWDGLLLSEAQLADQKELVPAEQLTIVCPSQWLFEAAKRSALFGSSIVVRIPYSIDTKLFAPMEKADCRKTFGLGEEGTYLLFAADNAGEKRKGFRFLVEALKLIKSTQEMNEVAVKNGLGLICLGKPGDDLEKLGFPVHALGYISDDQKITASYGASDIFVLPSLEDNLPNTIMESISCGRPVVAFSSGGIPDLIQDGINGFLATPGDARGLAEKIMRLVAAPGLRTRFGAAGREATLDKYRPEIQAGHYKKLYESLAPREPKGGGETGKTATAGPRMGKLLYETVHPPLIEHLYFREVERRRMVEEHARDVKTMIQQTEHITYLNQELEKKQKSLKKVLGHPPVKVMRKLKLLRVKE